jgi:exonuclease SbcC
VTISRLTIRNFQSLKSADIDLGTLTVIVGPSSSGKSAFVRAVRALSSNVRGTGSVTRGQKSMAITAHTDTAVVTLERGERSSFYRILDVDGEKVYTKLGSQVPPQVTAALRIEPVEEGGSVNFAGQFDKPYLLDESGAVVARQLGELTNVSQIFEAVRAANRARAAASSTLKTRRADLTLLTSRLADFQGLSGQLKALTEAEQINAQRRALAARVDRLATLIFRIESLRRTVDAVVPPPVPDISALNTTLNRFLDLQATLNGLAARADRLKKATLEAEAAEHSLAHLEHQLTVMVREAKVCPTCGQATS